MKKYSKEAVSAFIAKTAKLQETSMSMEDIYNMMMARDAKADAYMYFDEEGKPKKVCYGDFADEVFKTASKLSTLFSGIRAGSVVGLKLKNSPRWGIIFWALLMCGHSPLLLDARLATENANNLLSQAKAQAIIANDEAEFVVSKYRVNEIMNEEADYEFRPDWANHVIFCSSGTTGAAKMMVYTGANLCAQILASLDMPKETTTLMHPGKIRILAMLPFHHIFGFVAVFLWYSFYGCCLVYPSSIATSDLLYAVRKGKCTHIYSVPMFWDGIAQNISRTVANMGGTKADLFSKMVAYNTGKISKKEAGHGASKLILHAFQKKVLGKHVEYCISGGGFLSPKTQNTINGLGYPLYNGFGMTEVGVTSVEMSPNISQRLKGSIGHPFHGVEYKLGGDHLTTSDNGDVTGELMIRSPITHGREIIGGMLKRVNFEDGWFPTGDIVTMDSKGSYFMKGRIKDTIILSNGENVFPDEIEYYFKDVKHLHNAVCLGATLPGEKEEKITLVCEVDNSVTEEQIKKIYEDIKSINDTLPSEKKVQTVLIDKRPLPVSGSMKVKRFMIKQAIAEGSSDFIGLGQPKNNAVSFEGYDPKEVEEVSSKIRKVFAKILMLPEFKIDGAAIWTTDLGGDSMSYIEMCQTLNAEFGIEIPEDKYGVLGNLNDFTKEILDLLAKKPSRQKKAKK